MNAPQGSPEPARPAEAPADDLGFDLPQPAAPSRKRLLVAGLVAGGALLGAFLFGFLPRHHAKSELVSDARREAVSARRVQVVTPKLLSSDHDIVLTGNVRPLEETTIYPLANGYISSWSVDIGDKVVAGQTLAEIATPELDQQLAEARAQLAQAAAGVTQAEANREFSNTDLDRYRKLVPAGVASQQELDKSQAQATVETASVGVAKAAVNVQQANVRRLLRSKSFAHVIAPFAGTITSRSIDRGALVSSGNATPLFKVAALDPVRVFIQVPQDVAPGVKVGLAAKVTTREFAGRVFMGEVARSAGALDSTTRTMLVEVRVPNPKNELLTGMYAEVTLTLPSAHEVFELPATALLNDSRGLRIAAVDPKNKLRLLPISIERDTGATVQISSGITATDRIVKLASADMTDGERVELKK